ncbi:hypothetical protein [Neisseria perflava]|uniref:hypothetical protein n=1 Tax=Neisseria perflava TaxID=33053 RepID=UPI0020A1E46F|nr:hypothetical protein [Neisseria perflava]MCP1659350.1 hypothetical protein [Neisseria perflava]
MSSPFANNAVLLPFAKLISERALSRELPLPFRRPWGYADEAETSEKTDTPNYYQPAAGYAAVSQSWGFALHAVRDMAACAVGRANGAALANDYSGAYLATLPVSFDLNMATAAFARLNANPQLVYTPSPALGGYGRARVGAFGDIYADIAPVTGVARAVRACLHAAQAAVSAPFLQSCAAPRYAGTAALERYLPHLYQGEPLLQTCFKPRWLPALAVPCEYYEIAVPEETEENTYVCGIKPKSNRIPLRFRRHKVAHSAKSVPLPFACDIVSNTPVLDTYMINNAVSATFDNGQALDLLTASFTCDTGGYCWQGSITLPPDEFAKLGMDGREKGAEAEISVAVNAETFVFLAEDYSDNRRFGQKIFTVSGRSLTSRLGGDYAEFGDGTYRSPVYARQVCDDVLKYLGFAIESFGLEDWLIPKDVYSLTEKTPMAVLTEIAQAAGGFVCSNTALPMLSLKPRWPAAAWKIADTEPDVSIPASVVTQISGQRSVAVRANGVFVSATHATGAAGDVYREGTSREPRAAAQTNALYTDRAVLLATGIAALSDTGIHKTESVTLPVSDKYAVPLAELGQIWEVAEPAGTWKGVVEGVTLDIGIENDAPTVMQTVKINRYLDS